MNVRVHISYCDRIYHPDHPNPDYAWHLTARMAHHLWLALHEHGARVTFGDVPPDEPLDLLWTNRNLRRPRRCGRMIYFASVAHHGYVTRRVRSHRRFASVRPEGQYPLGARLAQARTVSDSDLVFCGGNQTVQDSFRLFPGPAMRPVVAVNWGIEHEHFQPTNAAVEPLLFLHNCNRFSIRKGTHLVCEAWRRFHPHHVNARLVFQGRHGDVDLERIITSLPGATIRLDSIPRTTADDRAYLELLSQSAFVVVPSLAEGQAGSLLEAMACGCMPIASRDSGVDAEQYGGVPVESDDPAALCNAMLEAVSLWQPASPEHVRREALRRHDWGQYRRTVVEAGEFVLSRPALRPSSSLSFLAAFVRDDLLGRQWRRREGRERV